MSLETVAMLALAAFGAGITIGTLFVNKGLLEKTWDGIRNWDASRKSPRHHCPHVRVERKDDGNRTVDSDFQASSDRFMACRRCGYVIYAFEHPSWINRNLPLWRAQPEKAEKLIRKARKVALRHPGGTGLVIDD